MKSILPLRYDKDNCCMYDKNNNFIAGFNHSYNHGQKIVDAVNNYYKFFDNYSKTDVKEKEQL